MSQQKEQKSSQRTSVLAGLDVGTTKVTFAIASLNPQGVIEVIGVGEAPSTGIRHGVVVNIEATTKAIQKAKEEAELMSGIAATRTWVSVGGAHIESFDSTGMVAIRNQEVAKEDIQRVIEAAKAVAVPHDRQVLHVLPNYYIVDGQDGILDPIGMAGVRLETSVHIVTGSSAAIQNLMKCAESAGLKVEGFVLEPLASSMSVLTEDERQLGCCVVDIGGGTCDMISYVQGSVVNTAMIPVGGGNFTQDVAMGLRTTQAEAENIKKRYGCALAESVPEEETLEVDGVGGRQARAVTRKQLCEILEARAEEVLSLVKKHLEDQKVLSRLGSGIVVTGGCSQLPGFIEMGDYVFDVPVRKGLPLNVGGLTDVVKCPSYSTLVGCLAYGFKNQSQFQQVKTKSYRSHSRGMGQKISGWFRRVKEIFDESL